MLNLHLSEKNTQMLFFSVSRLIHAYCDKDGISSLFLFFFFLTLVEGQENVGLALNCLARSHCYSGSGESTLHFEATFECRSEKILVLVSLRYQN